MTEKKSHSIEKNCLIKNKTGEKKSHSIENKTKKAALQTKTGEKTNVINVFVYSHVCV